GRAAQLVAGVNLDMVGESQELCGSTFLIEHPPCFAASFAEELLGRIRAEAVDWVRSYSGPGHYSLVRMAEVPYSGGSDHAVLNDPQVFVPCPMLIQWPDRFYHSSHDTPDKTDPRSLELAVRCAATYAAPLESQRHLVGGVGAQDRAERERFRRLELDTPNAATLFELAWYACDGARTVQQIAGLVWLETGADAGQAIAEFFEWTARRGLSEWTASREARWSSSAPATATP